MKNIKFILAAIFAFAALSCQKEDPTKSNTEPELVSVTLTTEPATKTHIHENDVTKIYWNEGDKIKVFTNENYVNSNAFSFSMSETPKDNFAKFSGEIAVKSTKFWAVYPDGNAKSCSTDKDGSDIVVSIPTLQGVVTNSFGTNVNISVAKGEIKEVNNGILGMGKYELTEPIFLNFKNVCTLLKFTAPDNAEDISSVTITANEIIAGNMTIDFSGTDPIVKSISGSNSITMTGDFAAGADYYFVVAPVTLTGISMTIQTKASETKSAETFYIANKGEFKLQSGVAKGLGKVNLNKMTKVSATATHQSPDGILSGTNVTFNLGTADKVSSVNLTVSQINGSATRNAKALTSTYSSDSAWPYLPQGDYSFTGSFSYNEVIVTIPATPFAEAVEAPTFTVNDFTAFTSYSKYVENKSSVANTLDGSSIYKTVTVNIAANILNSSNYKPMIKVDGNSFDPKTIDGKSCVSFGGNNWEQHDIKEIKWTFDNVTVTKTLKTAQIVHVTGIPYDYTFTNKNLDAIKNDSWTANGDANILNLLNIYQGLFLSSRTKEGGFMGIGAKEVLRNGYMVSRSFHIPANTNLQASVNTTGYVSWGSERTVKGYLGAVGSATQKCDTDTDTAISFTTPCSMTTSTGGSGWCSVQFQTNKTRLCVASEQVKDNNGNIYHFLNEAHLRYKE